MKSSAPHPTRSTLTTGSALAVALLLVACSPKATSAPIATGGTDIPVTTAVATYAPLAQHVKAAGTLTNKSQLRASFKVGAVLARIMVDEGQSVKAGQVLAVLSATEIDAGVEQARLAVAKSERDHRRIQQLFDGRAATQEQLDDVATGLSLAKSQLRAVQFNRNHSVIIAPSAGRVIKRLSEPGEMIAPGQPVLILALDGAGWVARISVADKSIVRLRVGDKAKVTMQAWPDRPALTATVSELAIAATPPLGTYEIELRLDTTIAAELRAGLVAMVDIEPSTTSPLALIPATSLRDGDGMRASVWLVNTDRTVQRQPVAVAFFADDQVAVHPGLPDGATIVVDGAAYLTEQSRVVVEKISPRAGSAL
jgi:RND family efflux transporter MFP subunit